MIRVSRPAALVFLAILSVTAHAATQARTPICAIDMGSNSFRRIVGSFDKGQYAQAMPYLDKASNAAPRPGRESADAGRRGEIAALRQKVQAKLG